MSQEPRLHSFRLTILSDFVSTAPFAQDPQTCSDGRGWPGFFHPSLSIVDCAFRNLGSSVEVGQEESVRRVDQIFVQNMLLQNLCFCFSFFLFQL